MTLSALGIAKDAEPLRHDNYNLLQQRQWKTSKIGPFATNLAVVFFNCTDEPKVMLFLEEDSLPYDGCNVDLCTWEFIENKFSKTADSCDLAFCDPNNNAASHLSITSALIVASLAYNVL